MSRNKLPLDRRVRVHLEWIQGTHEEIIKDEVADILQYIEELEADVKKLSKHVENLEQEAKRHE